MESGYGEGVMANNEQTNAPVVVWVLALLFLPLVVGEPVEDRSFQPSHEGADFPVGWTEFNLGGPFSPEVRMNYPAMANGEDKEMAGNGPFPWVLFIGDSGESVDGYKLLTEPLVQRGYIVVVTGPVGDETDIEATVNLLDAVFGQMDQQNQTNSRVLGSASNIDLEHWGLLGHGKGAAAAYLAAPFWPLASASNNHQPPRGLIGYGLDFEELSPAFTWDDVEQGASFSLPNAALFMTGTVDEIAPSQATMERVASLGGYGWQWMHLLGADHYQFQDTRSIFENDGDPTMSQSDQIEFAVDHTVAYLDTVLRGDHARFREAFNRALGPMVVSDERAYVDEDLTPSAFLVWENVTVSHNSSTVLNADDTFEINANWSLRNGDVFGDLPENWSVSVTCGWLDASWNTSANLDTNGTASCTYPMTPVAPGLQTAWMQVDVEGAPSMLWESVTRNNTPVSLLYPQPMVFVPQHGEAELEVSEVAVDPDGQAVRVVNATLVGLDSHHFSVEITEDQSRLILRHALDEEWLGECMLNVRLRSDGGVVDEINTSLRVMLTPFDDQIVKSGPVPIQEMDEDGAPLVFDLRMVVSDPEGEAILLRIGGQASGEQGPVRYVINEPYITLTPLPNQNGATVLRATVSDGSNPPLDLDIPVVVNAVNDPVVVNASLWEGDVVMDEDTVHRLELAPLAYDVDEDPLIWSVEGSPDAVDITRDGDAFLFTPDKDLNGVFPGLWLNVTDGQTSSSFAFSLVVEPVGDLPFLAVTGVQRNEGSTTATVQWSVTDLDGASSTAAKVFIDGRETAANHSCLENTPGSYQCLTLISLSQTANGTVSVQLTLLDEELAQEVIAAYVVDLTAPAPSTSGSGDEASGEGDLRTMVLVGVMLLMVAVLLLLVARQRGGGASAGSLQVVEEQEVQQLASSGGLLARVERLK